MYLISYNIKIKRVQKYTTKNEKNKPKLSYKYLLT